MCKYFAVISVASSEQVTLQFYFQIFYSTAPNKIVTKSTKLKNTNSETKVSWVYKIISDKKHIQRKKSSKYTPAEQAKKKSIKTFTKDLLGKL